jgi:DNA-binding SARP family transcriptional activator/tetratricopeptide (TPR) repeat protein
VFRLYLVGRVAAEADGTPLPVPSGDRVRALVGWLGLHPGLQSRGRVAAALWPDADEAQARARLRTTVWTLRQAWGDAAELALTGARDTLGFAEPFWVDASDDETAAVSDGELLPGIDDEWAETEREAYRQRQGARFRVLAEQAIGEGRTREAVDWARRRVVVARWDESAHRALVRALVADGDRAGAADAAHRFTERLRADLGVAPSPTTRSLHAEVASGTAPRAAVAIFGRAAELSLLDAAWRATTRGSGRVVVVTGEPGIGKTTLLDELSRRASARGARTARAAGLDVGGAMPFGVWLELARGLAAQVPPPAPAALWPLELTRLSEDLGAALGRSGVAPPVATPELERLRVFEASLRLVEWAAADRPVLLVVDDAHQADRASMRLLAHLARRLGGLPVAIALASPDRPTAEMDVVADVAARSGVGVARVAVGPIAPEAVAALAASLGLAGADDVDRVVAAAEGNALLATESARALAGGDIGLPSSLRAAVRVSAGRLSGPARRLLDLVAAAERPLTGSELVRLGEVAADETVAEVLAVGLVTRTDGRLGFRHGLLREAAYVDVPDPVPLHAALAEAIDPAHSAEVAGHWERAGRPDRAAGAWVEVAAYAQSVGALAEAADALTRALDSAPERGDLWLQLDEVYALLGRREESDRAWDAGRTRLPAAALPAAWCHRGDQLRSVSCDPPRSWVAYREARLAYRRVSADGDADRLRFRIDVGLAWNEAVAGDPARALTALAELGAAIPDDADVEDRIDLIDIGMQGLIRQGRFTEAADLARTAQPLLDRDDSAGKGWRITVNAAAALVCEGDDEGALRFVERAVEDAREAPAILARSLGVLAHLQARTGRPAEARATLAEQGRVVERLAAPEFAVQAAADAGLVALALGDPVEAADRLGASLDGGLEAWRPSTALARAEALALAGDHEAASVQLRGALEEPTTAADQPWSLLARVCFVQALIAVARDDASDAVRRLDEARAAWDRLLPRVGALTSEGYLANLLDLGRPPVLGLVEPQRELDRIQALRDRLTAGPGVPVEVA